MTALKASTIAIPELTMEFLRRVINELNGRRFEYLEELINETQPRRDFVSAQVKANDLLHVLPEMTRKFAAEIRPEFSRCHKLLPLEPAFGEPYTARDPISGVSIRCFCHWHVMEGDIVYRFDAAFS